MNLSYRIAVGRWMSGDGIAQAIYDTLLELGHAPSYFQFDSTIPGEVDVIFMFGPFGQFLHVPRQLANRPVEQRPTVVFWNTEGLPDLRIPWLLMRTISAWRSYLGRLGASNKRGLTLMNRRPLSLLNTKMYRFCYLGDFLYAHQHGWCDVFANVSAVYSRLLNQQAMPTVFAPFGGYAGWYADLGLSRDIDVLWIGAQATKRRHRLLQRVREELNRYGVSMYVVDNVETPFVFGQERTHLFNRTKITLNLLRTWYDENSLRICLAAPNGSLVVSEPLLAHVPYYQAGTHYVSAPIDELAQTILYYLEHEDERRHIANNARHLLTTSLTLRNSLHRVMTIVQKHRVFNK